MKISMWMLERWLEQYGPTATIAEGECTISGIRFYEGLPGLDDNYLYVCRMRDVYPVSASDQVLLMHRNDVISLSAREIYTVFNRCLDAFDFFNEWERALDSAHLSDNPTQAIVDASADMFGPMFAMDASLNLLAYSSGYEKGAVNQFWDDYVLSDQAIIPDLDKMHGSRAEALLFEEHPAQLFFEPVSAPYSYGVSVSIHDAEGKLDGHLVIASNAPMGMYEVQLAARLGEAIDRSRTSVRSTSAPSYAESILSDILRGGESTASDAKKLARLMRWDEAGELRAFCVRMRDLPQESVEGIRRQLPFMGASDVAVSHRGDIIGMIDLAHHVDALSELEHFASSYSAEVGCSNPCDDLSMLHLYMRQAREALKWFDGRRALARFEACALAAMTHSDDRAFVVSAAHPAVLRLREYDARRRAKLADTLRCFLRNERSYAKTAAVLYVHRNTVLYRIERIVEMTGVDLDNPDEREYLLASFAYLD